MHHFLLRRLRDLDLLLLVGLRSLVLGACVLVGSSAVRHVTEALQLLAHGGQGAAIVHYARQPVPAESADLLPDSGG